MFEELLIPWEAFQPLGLSLLNHALNLVLGHLLSR